MTLHDGLKEASEEVVVWFFVKLEVSTVINELHELFRHALRQLLNCGLTLLLTNFIVLFIFVLTSKTLPWELTLQEVQQNVANRLQVIPSRLLHTAMTVNRSISCCASERFAISIRNVLTGLRITVPLRQSEIYHVHRRSFVIDAHQEVIGLNVAMQEVLGVHELDTCDKLLSQHAHGLKRETSVAELEEVL